VKSKKFIDYTYVGDPINAVSIFNEKKVDEIIILDIEAS
jgi:cyclase